MEKKNDLRVTKTYMALSGAFTELLGRKRFEDITVNELCERAMVRRSTFYKHFSDKYDFFAFFIREMQTEFAEKIAPYERADIPSKHFIGLTGQFIDFLEENDRIAQRILKSDMLLELLEIFSRQIMRYTKQRLDEDVQNGRELLVSSDLLAACYSGAMLHMLLWWYKQKDPIPKDELLRQMADIIGIVGSGILS